MGLNTRPMPQHPPGCLRLILHRTAQRTDCVRHRIAVMRIILLCPALMHRQQLRGGNAAADRMHTPGVRPVHGSDASQELIRRLRAAHEKQMKAQERSHETKHHECPGGQ